MLSVAVHKDIAEYQPKIVGKMTMRTLVSITGALSVSVLAGLYIYFVLGLNVSDCTYFIYAVSLPFWCVGFVKPCGMPFEQFAPLWLKANFTNDRIFYKPSIRPRSGNPDNHPSASVPSVKGFAEHDRLAVCAKHLPLRHPLLSPAFALVGSMKAFECPTLRVLHAPLILPLEVQKLFLKICRFRSRIDQTVQQRQCPVKRLLDGIPQKPHVLLLDFLLAHIHPFSSAVRTASPCHTSFVPRSRVRTRNGR